MASPTLPVSVAEILYVALSHVIEYVDEHGTYPPGMADNMRDVLNAYDKTRSRILARNGADEAAVKRYSSNAAEGLARWLDRRAQRNEKSQADFEKWTEELNSADED